MSRITAPRRRPKSPVSAECVKVLRDMLVAAEEGELTAFYGVAQAGEMDAELIVAGDYKSSGAIVLLDELKEWVLENADEEEL